VTKLFILRFALELDQIGNNLCLPRKISEKPLNVKMFSSAGGLSEVTCAYMLN